jgi:hypothetical protein
MLTILRSIAEGKTQWSLEELAADSTILSRLQEAQSLVLVHGLLVEPICKGRYMHGVPLGAKVSGLTEQGALHARSD